MFRVCKWQDGIVLEILGLNGCVHDASTPGGIIGVRTVWLIRLGAPAYNLKSEV